MSQPLDELTKVALALPSKSRAFLAERLLETLDHEEDFKVSNAWLAELRKRCRELDELGIEPIPADEVFREVRSAIS